MSGHPTVAAFDVVEDGLTIHGIPIDRLAIRAGGTPFFAYDREKIMSRIQALRSALPADVKLSYAIKANPMPAIVNCINSVIDGFDVASPFEMKLALDSGRAATQITFAGPGKLTSELAQAVAAGIIVLIESPNDVIRLVKLGERLQLQPRVAIRINPDYQIKGSAMKMGGGSQQFGIDVENIPAMLQTAEFGELDFYGFHIFAGSQTLRADMICQAMTRNALLLMNMARLIREPIRYLNLGGGFGIPYFDRECALDIGVVGDCMHRLLDQMLRPGIPEANVIIELGRYLVGEAGIYVTRVIDRKVSRGKTYLIVDGGLHHQLAATGNFGQIIRRNYPIVVANKVRTPATERVTIVGRLCTPLDVLGEDVPLPRAEIDDLLVIFQAGAYGLTASPTAFLGHPKPVEMLV